MSSKQCSSKLWLRYSSGNAPLAIHEPWNNRLGSRSQTSALKKDRDLDNAHVMGRERTKVRGSTDALSSAERCSTERARHDDRSRWVWWRKMALPLLLTQKRPDFLLKKKPDIMSNLQIAVCCSVLQCVAVCCSVLECVAVCYSVLQCVAVCCSVLQCVAVCCP